MYSVIFVEDVYTQCAHTHVHEFIASFTKCMINYHALGVLIKQQRIVH